MKKFILFLFLLFSIVSIHSQSTIGLETQASTGTGSWTSRQAKLVTLIPSYTPIASVNELDIDKYGFSNQVTSIATGFFYTNKINNRWWIIDPEGKAGINIAMNAMNDLNTDVALNTSYDRIRELGYNGTGNFLDNESQPISYNTTHSNQFSYTRRINFFLNYKNSRKSYYPSTPSAVSGSLDYVFVLDPKFEEYCDNRARTYAAPYKDEKNLLGYFIDNEINFNQDQLTNFLSDLVPGDPSYDAALCFIQGQGITLAQVLAGNVSESVNQAFATMLAEHYYQITSAALKKYDPNHLNLGSRLNGRTRSIEGVVKSSAKWCDVVSVNFYDSYSPDVTITSTSKYLKWIDAPCMVGEFYVKGLDATNAGFVNGYSGAGWVVKTQAERGYFYQNTCLELLKSKIYVGWHYFKFRDDSNSNKGIVKTSSKGGEEYTELTSQMSLVNNNIFKLINYYDNTSEVEIPTKQNISFYLTKNNLVVKNIPAQSTLRIFELSGRLLKIFPLNQGENQCPLPGLIRGLYTLEVKGKGMQTVYTSKLIL